MHCRRALRFWRAACALVRRTRVRFRREGDGQAQRGPRSARRRGGVRAEASGYFGALLKGAAVTWMTAGRAGGQRDLLTSGGVPVRFGRRISASEGHELRGASDHAGKRIEVTGSATGLEKCCAR